MSLRRISGSLGGRGPLLLLLSPVGTGFVFRPVFSLRLTVSQSLVVGEGRGMLCISDTQVPVLLWDLINIECSEWLAPRTVQAPPTSGAPAHLA